jgi:hypothetical protein
VLRKIASQENKELMKQIKVRNLPAPGSQEPLHYLDKPGVLEVRSGSPKRGWATARFEAYLGNCRIYLTVVGPETEQSKHRLPFTRAEAEDITQAAYHLVKVLKKKTFGEELPAP